MIIDKKDCTGCFACANKCPKKCIKMVEDINGYIYPEIDESKCINCGLCKKVCPSINHVEFSKPIDCYAAFSKDKELRHKSSSGGLATVCAKVIIENGGVVYGASFCNSESELVKHIRITKIEDLGLIQGSKYVHSYINNTYELAENDLKQGLKVLFIGTPCQIAGLKNFLGKEYENLYTMDLICHGVPSQKYLREEFKSLTSEPITKATFRGDDGYSLKLYNKDKLIKQINSSASVFYFGFSKSVLHRENCFSCLYAKPERCSDITVGDFWGLNEKNSKIYDEEKKGFSAVLPITKKGCELLEECKKEIELEARNIDEIKQKNPQFTHPVKKPKNYEKIKNIYIKKGYKKMGNHLCRKIRIKLKIKNNKLIYNLYKAIKR